VKKIAFTTPKENNTGSGDWRLEGSIPITQIQTPTAHTELISSDEPRRIIRTINGILKNGIRMPLITPIV